MEHPFSASLRCESFIFICMIQTELDRHDDGTGGGYSLGNFPLLPLTSTECAGNDLTKCALTHSLRAIEHGDPTTSPGYCGLFSWMDVLWC